MNQLNRTARWTATAALSFAAEAAVFAARANQ